MTLKRSKPMPPRTTRLARSARLNPVNRKRKISALERAYGAQQRREWMKLQPCAVCGRTPSDAAHLTNGGMSRKADASLTVPLCADGMLYLGHHSEYDGGKRSFRAKYPIDLEALASRTEALWVAHQGGTR